MPFRPSAAEFVEYARSHSAVAVYRRLVADDLTPVSAYGKVRDVAGSFLFESVVGTERVGRYSFLGAAPFLWFEAYGNRVRTKVRRRRLGRVDARRTRSNCSKELTAQYHAPHLPGLPRFSGGAVGYAGYDVVRYLEHLPHPPADDRNVPDLSFAFYDRMVIFDHITKTVLVAVTARMVIPGTDPATVYADTCGRVDAPGRAVGRAVGGAAPDGHRHRAARAGPPGVVPGRYRVELRLRASTRRRCGGRRSTSTPGDAFQIVLSQRFRTTTIGCRRSPFTAPCGWSIRVRFCSFWRPAG